MKKNAYNFEFDSLTHGKVSLKDYTGRLILIVNTASLCSFTKQYAQIQQLWLQYHDKRLVIIAVPCNDFGKQEPLNNEEIVAFCRINFSASYIITKKVMIKGATPHPFFDWVNTELGWFAKPRWNFYKYLIGINGELIDWFTPLTSPIHEKILKIINNNLSNDL